MCRKEAQDRKIRPSLTGGTKDTVTWPVFADFLASMSFYSQLLEIMQSILLDSNILAGSTAERRLYRITNSILAIVRQHVLFS